MLSVLTTKSRDTKKLSKVMDMFITLIAVIVSERIYMSKPIKLYKLSKYSF